ncbi:hypothetical protein QO231_03060 [Sedimentitalea todarodis]|uniref:Uncharacterized protein n=2 Tax=Sedimentitalea todarodis TaxID=1631240 RepID=A0ABU3V9I3_9RHOB|nr:hypothetical protein [Sedimentitalea todarodis]
MAPAYLPPFIAGPDGSDPLFTFMTVFAIGLVLMIGVLYLTLHAMPERMAHESNHSQMQVVGILALLALFTHNNLFWVVAILVATFRMPDFLTPLNSIAASLEAATRRQEPEPPAPAPEPVNEALPQRIGEE